MANPIPESPQATTYTSVVTVKTNELLTPIDATVDPRWSLRKLGKFLDAFSAGMKMGTVDVQDGATTALAASSGTLTFTSVSAGSMIAVNGALFIAVSGTPIRSNGEFKVGVLDATDAADFATTFNASADARISGVLTASPASNVVTVAPSPTAIPVVSGLITNAVTIETLGVVSAGTLTPAATAATDTILINGTTLTFEKEMARQTATVSTGIAGDTVVVNGVTFTCVSSGAGKNQFNVGASDTATAANLAAAINAANSGVFGTITATSSSTTLSLRAVASGTAANAYTLTATGGWTATGATFSGGLATTNNKLDYGDTNSQTVAEILRVVKVSTSAAITAHVFLTPAYQVTVSSGSGSEKVTVNGTTVAVTWASSDTATAAALVTALNASTAISAVCVASSSAGVITLAPINGATLTVFVAGTGMTDTSLVNVYALYPGIGGNCIRISTTGGHVTASGARLTGGTVAQNEGVQASGQVTIASGSGTETITINGVAITAVWGTSDTATATAITANINGSTNALVQGQVYATSSAGVVTITAVRGGVRGMSMTLAASGTGCTVTTAWAGGAVPTQVALGSVAVANTFPGARLKGGVNGAANSLTW